VQLDLHVAMAGLLVGFTVGLTGMGGGALMTPILVLLFRVQPLAAVSSDLVASVIMKPVGGAVHARRGTVNLRLVAWLSLGSVPSAFAGVVLLRLLGSGRHVQDIVQMALGVALILAATAIVIKAFINLRRRAHRSDQAAPAPIVRPLPTIGVGVLGGLVVGMTSVGSGSLIIVMLMLLYPSLRPSQLVGTDLVQAIPLVGSAALGHVLFGDFRLGLTTSLLIGSLPGVYLGARFSANAPGRLVRRALALVLLLSGLKLVQLGNLELGIVLAVVVIAGPLLWRGVRATNGLRTRPRRAASQQVAA
jgi:uncharacterized membrane protein YfcA